LNKGRVEFRADKTGVVHLAVGKVNMTAEQIAENASVALAEIIRKKPVDAKGDFVSSVALSSTMGPGVRVENKVSEDK
jgi:large subunit ribosomal protein L1